MTVRDTNQTSTAADGILVLHREVVPPRLVPAAWLFGGGTHLVNLYLPDIERIYLPEDSVPAQAVSIQQHSGDTASFLAQCRDGRRAGKRARLRLAAEILRGGRVLDLGGCMAYDARWVDNGNIAHLLQHHVAILGYLRERLGVGPAEILVILDKGGPTLASRLFDLLGYETLATLRSIRGQTLSVEHNPDIPYSLLPFAARLLPPQPGGAALPTRVFIPRRGTRRIKNQPEIQILLEERSFTTIYLEDLPLPDQFRLFRGAEDIVAIHGAGLGHLAMRGPDSPPLALHEIFSPGLVTDVYRKYLTELGGHWTGCRGNLTSAFVRLTEESTQPKAAVYEDFVLDARALRAALDSPPFKA
jgi:hypothetical protein